MRVFLTRASGGVGSAVVRELIDAGHSDAGVVNSKEMRQVLAAAGVTQLPGSLTDLDRRREGIGDAQERSPVSGEIHSSSHLRRRLASRRR